MKRIIDILVSALALLLFSPFIIVLGIIIAIKMGRPVLFAQNRPGQFGQPFMMIKFRTMSDTLGEDGGLLPDKQRLTSFGKFLRSSSLDELPGLWCVLKGDMSLVGPRPLLMDYLPLYNKEQYRRHEVRPGVTGWAQVNGRNAISWEEKFKLDIWYVDHQSIWLDIKILLLTLKKVFFREGITAEGEVTMPAFRGSRASDK